MDTGIEKKNSKCLRKFKKYHQPSGMAGGMDMYKDTQELQILHRSFRARDMRFC